ncbi:HipA N-terminal domain-containing protein [Buttiauxella sp. W03-F01]|uniref:HipA N-terminal domain-containing protein n=1 Tax=Buttiauxella sp. W03-F01 TaxID=2904524 RepID=UPI00351D9A2D
MKSLSVFMNGYLVGKLMQEENGANSFQYEDSWLNTSGARPICVAIFFSGY